MKTNGQFPSLRLLARGSLFATAWIALGVATHVTAAPADELIASATKQIGVTTSYDPAYLKLDYPMGDPPRSSGVCTDVVIRAYRDAFGFDLQQAVHEDMRVNFGKYPKRWGLTRPDRNIDHRRVPNLMTWFERQGAAQPITDTGADYLPGDVVTFDLGRGVPHIGIVDDSGVARTDRHYILHNIGAGTQSEDILFRYKITGHYRFVPAPAPTPNSRQSPARRGAVDQR